MITGLQEQFREEFLRTARERLQRATAALDELATNPVLSHEMHALAGEASLIGFRDVAEAARVAEELARKALDGDASRVAECAMAFRKVRKAVRALGATASDNSKKVLVIDDSPLVLEQLTLALKARGVDVVGAATSAAGLEIAGPSLSLIVTDYHLDDIGCAELIPKLRKRAPRAKIAVISGLSNEELEQKIAEVGADEGVSKMDGLEAIVVLVTARLSGSESHG